MATAISGLFHVTGAERTARLFHKLPTLFHFHHALNRQSNDLRLRLYPKSFFGALKRAFIDKYDLRFNFALGAILTSR
jgi:hypothetical protein